MKTERSEEIFDNLLKGLSELILATFTHEEIIRGLRELNELLQSKPEEPRKE